jgi:hypothetical protein
MEIALRYKLRNFIQEDQQCHCNLEFYGGELFESDILYPKFRFRIEASSTIHIGHRYIFWHAHYQLRLQQNLN